MTSLVSVITPMYNSEKYISECIVSVLNQTFTQWEMIIVNDGSTDNSKAIISSYAKKDKRLKILDNNTNQGAAISRNKAIKAAQGRFIAFLDSDDQWYPKKLEIQINFMLKNEYAFSYTSYEKTNANGNRIGIVSVPESVNYQSLLKTCSIGCLTAVYDTVHLGKVYMPDIRKRQDYGLWLRILKQIPKGYGINKTLAKYRVRKDSISGNKWKAAQYQWKIYRNVEKLNFFKASYYFTYYTLYGFLKTYFN